MGTPFSHTYLVFAGENGEQIFHATGAGLYQISRCRFLQHNKVVAEFLLEIDSEAEARIKHLASSEAGERYGFWQNIGIVIAKAFKLQVNPFQDGVNCSEWVAEALKQTDAQAFSDFRDLNTVEPSHIYNYMRSKRV
jgi:hypothetical protein